MFALQRAQSNVIRVLQVTMVPVLLLLVLSFDKIRQLPRPERRPRPPWLRRVSLGAMALSGLTMAYLELSLHSDIVEQSGLIRGVEAHISEDAEASRKLKDYRSRSKLFEDEIQVINHAVKTRWLPELMLDSLTPDASEDVTLDALLLDEGRLEIHARSGSQEDRAAYVSRLTNLQGLEEVEVSETLHSFSTRPPFKITAKVVPAMNDRPAAASGRRVVSSVLIVVLCYLGPLGFYHVARYEGRQGELKKAKRAVERLERHLADVAAIKRNVEEFDEELEQLLLELERLDKIARLIPTAPFNGGIEELRALADEMDVSLGDVEISAPESSEDFEVTQLFFEAAASSAEMNPFLGQLEGRFPHLRVVDVELSYEADDRIVVWVTAEVYSRKSSRRSPQAQPSSSPPATAV